MRGKFESQNLLHFSFEVDSVSFAFVSCLLRVLAEAIAIKYLLYKTSVEYSEGS